MYCVYTAISQCCVVDLYLPYGLFITLNIVSKCTDYRIKWCTCRKGNLIFVKTLILSLINKRRNQERNYAGYR